MKIILTLLIFIVAFYIAAMMFRRLTQAAQQLADLRSDLAKSDAQLQVKLTVLQQEREAIQRETPQLEASPREASPRETSSTRSDANTDQTLSPQQNTRLKM